MGTIYSSLASRKHYGPQDEPPTPSVHTGDTRRPAIQTQHVRRKLTEAYYRFGQKMVNSRCSNFHRSVKNCQQFSEQTVMISRTGMWKQKFPGNSMESGMCQQLHVDVTFFENNRDHGWWHTAGLQVGGHKHDHNNIKHWRKESKGTQRLTLKVHDLMRNEMMIKSLKLNRDWGNYYRQECEAVIQRLLLEISAITENT